jgi:hypothetical protein
MNTYTIYTCETDGPANMRWFASFSPLDEGEATENGYGATEWDAMADLCANHDLPEVSK